MPSRSTGLLVLVLAVSGLGVGQGRSFAQEAGPPDRIRIEAPAGSSLLVHGTYPRVASRCVRPSRPVLHARFAGAIEVGRDADGSLFVVGELPFEDYLKGIAEVPRAWPMEALKAQVVAARSYALARMRFPDAAGERLGYDLCATSACQVYTGLGVQEGPWGRRWVRAVEETRGEVLVYEGRAAETVYFSTSKGRTLGNEDVWGGAPVPYLRPVRERDDRASPVSRWRARFPFGDLTRFLRDAGAWRGPRIRAVAERGPRLVLRGGGGTVRMSRAELRSALNASASCLRPSRYPSGGLPQAVPSRWFRAEVEDGTLRLDGRGWGHGVGMVQWGAYGKARRGLTYGEILAFYYGGLQPEPLPVPETIRVGIAVGLESVTVEPSGPVEVPDPAMGAGPWRFSGGKRLRVRPASPPPVLLAVSAFEVARRGRSGEPIRASLRVDRALRGRLVLLGDEGPTPLADYRLMRPGRVRLRGTLPTLPGGTYRIAVQVTDGIDVVLTVARTVRVEGPPATPTSPAAPTEPARAAPETGAWPIRAWVAVGLGAGLVLLAGLVLVGRLRSRR